MLRNSLSHNRLLTTVWVALGCARAGAWGQQKLPLIDLVQRSDCALDGTVKKIQSNYETTPEGDRIIVSYVQLDVRE